MRYFFLFNLKYIYFRYNTLMAKQHAIVKEHNVYNFVNNFYCSQYFLKQKLINNA